MLKNMSMLHLQRKWNTNHSWQKYRGSIMASALFTGLDQPMVLHALDQMHSVLAFGEKNTVVFQMGDPIDRMGLLLQGSVEISRQDMLGNAFIVTHLHAPSLFAEVLACAGLQTSPVNITAVEPTVILLIDFGCLLASDSDEWPGKPLLISNMLKILARKNLMLNHKLDVMSKRGIRAKIAAVLLEASADQLCPQITLPYNRQQLADYLAVDRSALSRELSQMKKERLIDFHRQSFHILDSTALAAII